MDSKKFFGKIREIIREEIEYALEKKLVKSNLNSDDIKEVKSRDTELIERVKQTMIKNDELTNKNKKSISKYSNINDLLEETRRSLKENFIIDDDTIMMTSDLAKDYMGANSVIPNGISPDNVPDDVMNALTRNYSDLMKKIDEKKGRS
jgi:hypothetical protein